MKYSNYISYNPENADSTPDLDDWGPDSFWSCEQWVIWHKALEKKYGLEKANEKFILEFSKPGFGAASYDCRTFNDSFKKYAKNKGFYDSLFGGLTGMIAKPLSASTTLATSITDMVTDIGEGSATSIKVIKYAVPAIILAAALGVGVIIYNFATKGKVLGK